MEHKNGRAELSSQSKTIISYAYNKEKDRPFSASTEGHTHPYYEIYVFVGGDVSFSVEDRCFELVRGDVVLSRPNTYHHSICHSECYHEHYCLSIDSHDDVLNEGLNRLAENVLYHLDEQHAETVFSLLKKLSENETCSFDKYACFYRLLSMLQTETQNHQTAVQSSNTLQTVLSYINDKYSEIESVKDICRHCFVSQATLERLFRNNLQITPYKYLESKKLAGACRSLCEGKSVSTAAYENGFSDCSHFIAVFKKRFGETPLQYKRRYCKSL